MWASRSVEASRRRLFSGVLLATVLSTAAAWADDAPATKPPEGDAKALLAEGKALFKKKDYTGACPKLEQSHDIEADLGTLSLLARCKEAAGQTASAWRLFVELEASAAQAKNVTKRNFARWRAGKLENKLSHVWVEVPHPVAGLEVRVGGFALLAEEWGTAVAADPGSVEIQATAPGHQPFDTTVDVSSKEMARVTIPALEAEPEPEAPAAPPPAPPAPPPPPAPPKAAPTSGPPVWTWVAYGVGVAGLAVGAGFGLKARSKNDDSKAECSGDVCNSRGFALRKDAIDAARFSNVGFGIGIAGVAAGTVLLLLPRNASTDASDSAQVTPIVGPRTLGVSGRMAW